MATGILSSQLREHFPLCLHRFKIYMLERAVTFRPLQFQCEIWGFLRATYENVQTLSETGVAFSCMKQEDNRKHKDNGFSHVHLQLSLACPARCTCFFLLSLSPLPCKEESAVVSRPGLDLHTRRPQTTSSSVLADTPVSQPGVLRLAYHRAFSTSVTSSRDAWGFGVGFAHLPV